MKIKYDVDRDEWKTDKIEFCYNGIFDDLIKATMNLHQPTMTIRKDNYSGWIGGEYKGVNLDESKL